MTPYSKLIVYYFSGTGNSATVARWLSDCAMQKGMEVDLINIAQVKTAIAPIQHESTLIAFCSPVHGFNYPPIMQAFIRRFPKAKNPVLLLNTRAGMLINKWITPGISGITFYLSALILSLKGYRIRAMFPVDLPSNWIPMHPGLNMHTVSYLHIQNKARVTKFASKVLEGATDFRSVFQLIQDVIVSPISVLYYLVGRFYIAKTFYASVACTQCGLCAKSCPARAIKWVDKRPFWTYKCENCIHCMSFCPHKAIETAHGSIIAFTVLFSSIAWVFFKSLLDKLIVIDSLLVNMFLESALMLVLLAAWYRIVHLLLRYKWFNKLITYASLTSYKFWGRRYRSLKL